MTSIAKSINLRDHFDGVALNDARPRRAQRGFHSQLLAYFRHHIPAGSTVLELGCGAGDLISNLRPSKGVGCDFSQNMLSKARARYEQVEGLEFRVVDLDEKQRWKETFDHIILDYLTGYLRDIQAAFEGLAQASHSRTRLHITSLNTLWRGPLRIASALGLVMPQPPSAWLAHQDLINLLELSGWEVVRMEHLQLFPFEVPFISSFFNRVLVRLPLVRHLGITVAFVARPRFAPRLSSPISCSVVVPARNEAGNIRSVLERIPVLGTRTEVILVEGHSKDNTWSVIETEVKAYKGPHRVRAVQQPGRGKWDAVHAGFALAEGDVLVVQDADLTAPPEDLPKFYAAIASGNAEFANGSRLVYPMEHYAMRFLNLLGNKFFAIALSYVLGQSIKDSLCGTKMLLRSDYERVLKRIAPLGSFDPFGDFNLLFGASLLDLRLRDIPVRYKDRTYGETNISRFRHGVLLMRMTWFGLWKVRCISTRDSRRIKVL